MENNNPSSKPQSEPGLPVYIPNTKVETRSHLDKLAEVFLPEDLNSIGNNIVNQIMIPAILKTAGDIIHRSIDMIFGTNYSSSPSQTQSNQTYWTTYRNSTSTQQPQGTMQILPVRSGVYDYSVVRFQTVDDAQIVLNNMRDTLQNTGRCSVGKYLEFAKAKTIPEDFNYGWTSLSNVYLEPTGDREFPYRMVLPNPIALPKQNDRYYI